MEFHYKAIGRMITPFKEKFGIPRQSLMMDEARALIKLNPDSKYRLALKSLEEFSHIWIIFDFHKKGRIEWTPLIDTPRVEAGERRGVFATRSPHRPNSIGMSAVKLLRIDYEAQGGIEIFVSGVDLMDGTPILDIKPYLPFSDRIDSANSGWASSDIRKYSVRFSAEAEEAVNMYQSRHPRLRPFLEEMVAYDPRPTSQRRATPIHEEKSHGLKFAFRVLDLDVRWSIDDGAIVIDEIIDLAKA